METSQRVVLSDVISAHSYAGEKRSMVSDGAVLYDSQQVPVPEKPLFDYFFKLQGEVEKNGNMDYNSYASHLWNRFYDDPTKAPANPEQFDRFRKNLIANLHSIDMEPLVYPHVKENLAMLLSAREHQMRGVALWSTGDVAATGYQVGKIEQSGVVRNFLDAVKKEIKPADRRKVKDKTQYIVDDDKFLRLTDHVEGLIDGGEDKPKIVIIEDSSKNFDKVEKELERRLGSGHGVKVVPIWAAYSREGLEADAAIESEADFRQHIKKLERLNAIRSFAELLDPKFDDIFQDAHVFVDFDGVIGDNVAMRQEQAKAIYHSLLVAGFSLGLSDQQISKRLSLPEAA